MAATDVEGTVHDKVTEPPVFAADAAEVVFAVAKNGLFVPTSVAVNPVTANGGILESCPSLNLPCNFAILYTFQLLIGQIAKDCPCICCYF